MDSMKHNLSAEESAEQRQKASARRWRIGLIAFMAVSILIIVLIRVVLSALAGGPDLDGAISINLGDTIDESIESAGEEDYFRFTVPQNGTLRLFTDGDTDTSGRLLNSDGLQLANDDDSGSGANFEMIEGILAGTYYIGVRHSSSSGTGDYRLSALFERGGDDLVMCDIDNVSSITMRPNTGGGPFGRAGGDLTVAVRFDRDCDLGPSFRLEIKQEGGIGAMVSPATVGDALVLPNERVKAYNAPVRECGLIEHFMTKMYYVELENGDEYARQDVQRC